MSFSHMFAERTTNLELCCAYRESKFMSGSGVAADTFVILVVKLVYMAIFLISVSDTTSPASLLDLAVHQFHNKYN